MTTPGAVPGCGPPTPETLRYCNAGFLTNARVRRILALAGHRLRPGVPQPGDGVAVWGKSPYARRGEAMAERYAAPLIRIEDAFLRSIRPGRMGDPPIALLIDPKGVHFDSATPSTLEHILKTHSLDDSHLLRRARDGIERLRLSDLSKYNLHDPALAPPAPGYVLIIDQTRDDASITAGKASFASFREMMFAALDEHPTARIVIKIHPETMAGLRPGHFTQQDATGRVSLLTDPVSPHALLAGAIAVYTVSSQIGFEAILAGHRPRVFGQPFYAGWGLTAEETPLARRTRPLTKAQLFAAAMILAPVWYDPCRDRLCRFEDALDQLEAEVRTFRDDRHGYVALGMRAWKRGTLQAFFGREKPVVFARNAADASLRASRDGRAVLVWSDTEMPGPLRRIEDGFLRSRGLGANLVAPLSLVTDDLGIHYDPTRPSRLETLITAPLPPGGLDRAQHLIKAITDTRLTKYNLGGTIPALPEGHRVLVVGQVEDDASIRFGATGEVRTNLGLMRAARTARPDAVLIWKPHPDVEAGLRPGTIAAADLAGLADVIAANADPATLIDAVQEVWTITSLMGFEALLRGRPVTCLGAPFYAGWGLTQDLGPIPERRLRMPSGAARPRPDLATLVHAALIAYPRYTDPITRRPCPPEVIVERLATGALAKGGVLNRAIARLQGRLATYAHLWRR